MLVGLQFSLTWHQLVYYTVPQHHELAACLRIPFAAPAKKVHSFSVSKRMASLAHQRTEHYTTMPCA